MKEEYNLFMRPYEYKKLIRPKKENMWLKTFLIVVKSSFFALFLTFLLSLAIGYRPVLVIGYSMEPEISYHDVIFVKKVPIEEIKVGDIVKFTISQGLVPCTHRVVEILDNNRFVTKGESPTASKDDPIRYDQIDGKVMFVIPWVGNVILYLAQPLNFLFVTLLIFNLIYLYITLSYNKYDIMLE